MSFLFSKKPTNSAFGYKVTGNAGLPKDLDDLKGNIVKSNKKYREELSKYREIASFNKQLTNGYIKNLEAMIDVSKLMNYYVEIFRIFKEEFEKNEALLNTTLNTQDIQYLETLTRSRIDELVTRFMTETDKVKTIYTQYGKTQEVDRVSEAQQALQKTVEGADYTMGSLTTLNKMGLDGGRKKRLPRFNGKRVHLRRPTKK
jgi:hypothetical protein